jgi:hypothetical protein
MQTIFDKCLFKENGKLSKHFHLILRGLKLPTGSDTMQIKILCGVSDPGELSLAGYQTLRNNDRDMYIL